MAWWKDLSEVEKKETLTCGDSSVLSMAIALRGAGNGVFEIDSRKGHQRRFRFVKKSGEEPVAVAKTRARLDTRNENPFSLLSPKQGDWILPKCVQGTLCIDVDAETLDVIAGNRAFSTPCRPESSEDAWCKCFWYKAKTRVTLDHFLANLAEVLMWRRFWRDHDMASSSCSAFRLPRSGDDQAGLDAWWWEEQRDRDAVLKEALCFALKSVAKASRSANGIVSANYAAAIDTLLRCLQASSRLYSQFLRESEDTATVVDDEERLRNPSSLAETSLDEDVVVAWFRSAVHLGLQDARCKAQAAALLEGEEGKPVVAHKQKKRKKKKKSQQSAPILSSTSEKHQAAATTIVRCWKRHSQRQKQCFGEAKLEDAPGQPDNCNLGLDDTPKSSSQEPTTRDFVSDDETSSTWQQVSATHSSTTGGGQRRHRRLPPSPVVSCSSRTPSSSSAPRILSCFYKKPSVEAKPVVKTVPLDLTKTAEVDISYSDALRKNTVHQDHDEMMLAKKNKHVDSSPPGAACHASNPLSTSNVHQATAIASSSSAAASGSGIVDDGIAESEEVIWRLTKANLSLRRDNLRLQAEVSRLRAEMSTYRGGASASVVPRHHTSTTNDSAQYAPPSVGDGASVSSESHYHHRKTRDDGKRLGSFNDANSGVLLNSPVVFSTTPSQSRGYYYYESKSPFDASSDDGRLTIHSDNFQGGGGAPLEAVRECAVLVPPLPPPPLSQDLSLLHGPRRGVAVSSGGSRGGSSSSAKYNLAAARVVTDSAADASRASEDDDFSSSDEEEDVEVATTTTRASGKPPSLARANLSLDEELSEEDEEEEDDSSMASCPPKEAPVATKRKKRPLLRRVVVDEFLFSTSSRLADDVRAFAEVVSRRQRSCESAWRSARELVRDVAKSLWPRARVEPYGSCVTRLSLADASSDVDLVIRLPKVRLAMPAMTPGDLEGRNAIKETWPQELARRLRSEEWVDTSSVRTIASAFVPIVKLETVPLGDTREVVRLDISFDSQWHHGLEANKFVLRTLNDLPCARLLLLVLKKHAAERGLCASYTGGLSSYALTLLVVRYLQEQPANGSLDPAALLLGFLDFYAHRFDAGKTGISVGRACFFERAELGRRCCVSTVNTASSPLVVNSRSCAAHRSFHFDPLYVEDPLNPRNNVGRNCFRIAQIQRAWSDAFRSLSDALAKTSRPIYCKAEFASAERAGKYALAAGRRRRPPNLLSSMIFENGSVCAAPSAPHLDEDQHTNRVNISSVS